MRIWRGQHSRTVVVGVAFAIFVICCVLPVAYLVTTAFNSPESAASAMALDSRQRGLLYNTMALGVGTAALATAIGAPLGVVLAHVPLRRKALVRLFAGSPVLLPPYVVALAWLNVGSPRGPLARLLGADRLSDWTYSLPAAILILSFVMYPLSMLATEAAMRRIDGRLEEAGLVAATPGRVLWRISLPLAAPSVLAAALIVFVLVVSEFSVPGLLRVRVYTTEVFTAFAALYDFSRALVLAAPLVVLCVVFAAVAAALLGDRLAPPRRVLNVSPVAFDGWRRPATAAVSLVVAIAVALPVLILVREVLDGPSLATAAASSANAIVNSLLLASVGATVVIAVAVWLGYAHARASRAARLAAQVVLVVSFAVPSTVVGVGLIGLWNRAGPIGAVYGTHAMLLLAYLARFVPVAALILAAAIQTVPASQEEAAAIGGAGWSRAFRGIVLPQLRGGLAAAWVVTFVLAFGEVGASILVAPPGETTLPIRVYTMIANAPSSHVAGLALLQSLVVFMPLAVLGAYIARREAR